MVFLDRSRSREVAHLEWRIRLFGVGAILAVLGMYFEMPWMINVAIGVLVLGFLLRFVPSGSRGDADASLGDPDGLDDVGLDPEDDGAR